MKRTFLPYGARYYTNKLDYLDYSRLKQEKARITVILSLFTRVGKRFGKGNVLSYFVFTPPFCSCWPHHTHTHPHTHTQAFLIVIIIVLDVLVFTSHFCYSTHCLLPDTCLDTASHTNWDGKLDWRIWRQWPSNNYHRGHIPKKWPRCASTGRTWSSSIWPRSPIDNTFRRDDVWPAKRGCWH